MGHVRFPVRCRTPAARSRSAVFSRGIAVASRSTHRSVSSGMHGLFRAGRAWNWINGLFLVLCSARSLPRRSTRSFGERVPRPTHCGKFRCVTAARSQGIGVRSADQCSDAQIAFDGHVSVASRASFLA
ncbi:hypothetical protein AMAG_18638 [Allomyces macrogynus ATCC 38327]|uniref:Uncharacterized protein n=1 Tax=Allomyces macrogynus (strain ATCC 38327) TaxID=578462 RepID=A0A0L0SGK5_ALLM3|nr:hypothetical protein AMAG_18638 [Allomyces macrogynus ATCC 38327]|eukprot:KNE61485.1 hypothetical protein AMAG_18638 [Allomyces macrogynus ATCC 38327]